MATQTPRTESDLLPAPPAVAVRQDLMALTKFRLSSLVVVTTLVGYLAGCDLRVDWRVLFHTLLGTAFSAFGAAVFNQLMEIEADARMRRTMDRPLPARRLPAGLAFGIACVISAFGVLHLARTVTPENPQAAFMAALTLVLYVLVYTPMKRRSSLNTIVGAVAGALPPVIGWVAAGRSYDAGAFLLFGILFFWQLPHFVAINWMYREEYEKAGFAMWSNGDLSGKRSATLCVIFSAGQLVMCAAGWWPLGLASIGYGVASVLLGGWILWLSLRFLQVSQRDNARKLFLSTLLFLPAILTALLVFWRK